MSARGRSERAGVFLASAALLYFAGCGSGPLGERPKVNDFQCTDADPTPYRNLIDFDFSIYDDDMTQTSVQIQYSVDGGGWKSATIVSPSKGTVSGSTIVGLLPAGGTVDCGFSWNSYADGVGLDADQTVTLRLTPSDIDGTGTPVTSGAPITVNNHYPALLVSGGPITFGVRFTGVAETPAQEIPLTITNGTGDHATTLDWEVTPPAGEDYPWLVVNGVPMTLGASASGTALAGFPYDSTLILEADVDGAGLGEVPGYYAATLEVMGWDPASNLAHGVESGAPITVPVSVRVVNPEPVIAIRDDGVSPSPAQVTSLSFQFLVGDPNPPPQSFWIWNEGDEGSVLSWTATDNAGVPLPPDWLTTSATPPQDVAAGASQEVTVTADPAGLTPATYNATITVTGEDTRYPELPTSRTVNVSFWIQRRAEVSLSVASHQYPYWVNKAGNLYSPESFDVVLSNLGDEPLNWSVNLAGLPSWITSVTPSSGTGLAGLGSVSVRVTVDADTPVPLPASAADYTHVLPFTALNGEANTVNFTAGIHVYNPATILCAPGSLSFTRFGNVLVPSQTFTITRSGTNVPDVQWTATDNTAWASMLPASGTLTGSDTITVSVSASGLPQGTHTGQITIDSPDAVAPATVFISFTVITEINIGTGTFTWSHPMYTTYEDSRTQVIYLQSDIGVPCTISGLSLYVTQPPLDTSTTNWLNNWTIRMKHTALSAYATGSWEGTGWTTVHQNSVTVTTTGWVRFNFSPAFVYNGTSNLMIDFSHNNMNWWSAGMCRYTSGSPNYRSVYSYSDSWHGDPLNWVGTFEIIGSVAQPFVSYNVPNVKLHF